MNASRNANTSIHTYLFIKAKHFYKFLNFQNFLSNIKYFYLQSSKIQNLLTFPSRILMFFSEFHRFTNLEFHRFTNLQSVQFLRHPQSRRHLPTNQTTPYVYKYKQSCLKICSIKRLNFKINYFKRTEKVVQNQRSKLLNRSISTLLPNSQSQIYQYQGSQA